MAGEEKVGRWDRLRKMSSCVTMDMRGWDRSSQFGIWPFVTIYTCRSHGANCWIDRSEYFSSLLSLHLFAPSCCELVSVLLPSIVALAVTLSAATPSLSSLPYTSSLYLAMSAIKRGSLPFTHVYTTSIGPYPSSFTHTPPMLSRVHPLSASSLFCLDVCHGYADFRLFIPSCLAVPPASITTSTRLRTELSVMIAPTRSSTLPRGVPTKVSRLLCTALRTPEVDR
mmetsp:Transcript_34187/g.88263  ORF Transcript_34187/g.88263 Transcript_34187/m.88263 type:complete len:226 (+) Transcript_34187:3148-3825(+)